MSAQHARIEGILDESAPKWGLFGQPQTKVRYLVTDLKSTNGTFLNRCCAAGCDADRLQFLSCLCLFLFFVPRKARNVPAWCQLLKARKFADKSATASQGAASCRGKLRPLMPVEIKAGDTISFGKSPALSQSGLCLLAASFANTLAPNVLLLLLLWCKTKTDILTGDCLHCRRHAERLSSGAGLGS